MENEETSSERHAAHRAAFISAIISARCQNWLKLQNEYECFFFVADWHALTTHYEDTSPSPKTRCRSRWTGSPWASIPQNPRCSSSRSVLEHAELHVLLSMITPLCWLERVPTYKEQIENLKDRDLGTYGFLGYPLLQSADIVMYGEPKQDLLVPVGEDQVPHVELTREIVRRFNSHFGFEVKDDLFREDAGREPNSHLDTNSSRGQSGVTDVAWAIVNAENRAYIRTELSKGRC